MLILRKKKFLIKMLVLFFILINLFNIKSFALVNPTTDFYVNDYANLLNNEIKDYIINVNKKLYNQTGAQIVVVTIPSLEENSLEEYANQLFNKFGIGDKTKNNGVLLLLSLKERQFRIEVGYGLEGILTDGKTGRIQDEYIIPYLKNNNWNQGIKNGFNAILKIVADEYNIDVGAQKAAKIEDSRNYEGIIAPILFISVMVVSGILGMTSGKLYKKKKINLFMVIMIYIVFFLTIFASIMCITGIDTSGLDFIEYIIGMLMFIAIPTLSVYLGTYCTNNGKSYSRIKFILFKKWFIL